MSASQEEMDTLTKRVDVLEVLVQELQGALALLRDSRGLPPLAHESSDNCKGAIVNSQPYLQTPERTPQTMTPKKTYNSSLIRSIRTEFVDGQVSHRTPIAKTSTTPKNVGQEYKKIQPVPTDDIPLGAGREVVIGSKKKDVKEIKESARPPRAAASPTAAVAVAVAVPAKEETRVEVKRGGFTISLPQSAVLRAPTPAPAPAPLLPLPLPELPELPETQEVGPSGSEFKLFWQNSDLSFPPAELSSFPPPPPPKQQQQSGWGLFATSSPTGGSNIPSPTESLLATLLKGGSVGLLDDEAAGKTEDHVSEFL